MKNSLETRLGVFVALAVIVAAILLETAGGLDFLRRGRTVSARFNNVLELKVGDPVKMAGKQIGRVEDIEFADNKVVVGMKITDPKAVVHTDSRATIRFSGLMGQNFVSVDFGKGKGAPIESGTTELETYEQADFNQLMTKLDDVTSGIKQLTDNFSGSTLSDMLLPFTDFLKDTKPKIMGLLTNAEAISAQVASGEGTIGKLIMTNELYAAALNLVTNFGTTADDAKGLLGDARGVVADLRAGKGTLGKLTTDSGLYDEMAATMTNLNQIMTKINKGEGTVGKVINDDSLLNNAKLTLQKIDKATETLEDQGPLAILSLLAKPLGL
jgi:phospholipid/cholesterol/gamma-HCH transport system substrate-binding protein